MGGQLEEGTDLEEAEEPEDGFEIVEISALDHFSTILREAQRVATKAEEEKLRKCPHWYSGNSKRTLKRRKKVREDLAKQGYLSVFDFIAHVDAKEAAKKVQTTQKEHVAASVIEIEDSPKSEESAPEVLGIEDLASKRRGQVCRRNVLMH